MAKETRISRAFTVLKTGKRITRAKLADAIGSSELMCQSFVRFLNEYNIDVTVEREGRRDTHYTLIDVQKMKEVVERGGRLDRRAALTNTTPRAARAASKSTSTKGAGKSDKKSKTKADNSHLNTAPLFDNKRDTPATKEKPVILDKTLDTGYSDREMNDIRESLGITI